MSTHITRKGVIFILGCDDDCDMKYYENTIKTQAHLHSRKQIEDSVKNINNQNYLCISIINIQKCLFWLKTFFEYLTYF